MIAAYEDREAGMGIGMDDPQIARLWDIVLEQSESISICQFEEPCLNLPITDERIAVLEQEFRKLSAAFPSATVSFSSDWSLIVCLIISIWSICTGSHLIQRP